MNTQAERHLAKAEGYLAKGEEFYRKAAAEMIAAKESDPTLTTRAIAEKVGKDHSYVVRLMKAGARAHQGDEFVIDWHSGSNERATVTRKMLADAPLEQIEQIIAGLPKDRQQAIGAAAGHGYLAARQDYDETERNLTSAEKQEREAASESLTQRVREASGGFLSLGIAGHLEQATEELQELDSPTEESMRIIIAADADWRTELQVKVAMVGLDYAPVEV